MSVAPPLRVVVRRTEDQGPAVPAPMRVKAQRRGARDALAAAAKASSCPDQLFEKASPRGAPLPTAAGWHWSITHDRALVAGCVWPHAPVGIDVERIELRRRVLVERVASPEERARMGETAATPLDALGFARLWTAKEAVLKAERIGLPGLEDCRVVAEPEPWLMRLEYRGEARTVFQTRTETHVVSACVLDLRPNTILWQLPPGVDATPPR